MKRFLPLLFILTLSIGIIAPVATSVANAQALPISGPVLLPVTPGGGGTTTTGTNYIPGLGSTVTTGGTQPTTGTSNTSSTNTAPIGDDPSQHIPSCADFTHLDLGACVAWAVYYIPYTLGHWVMGQSAKVFDLSASLVLSSRLYTAGSFLQQGWQVTRDFANIFFILILLFIALCLVLDYEIGHANPKKMLLNLVLVALVINFSFFITEVVIDTSNALALVFYNQVTVTSTSNGVSTTDSDAQINSQLQGVQGHDANGNAVQYIQNEKPLSVALVQAMQPQILADPAFYNQLCAVSSGSGFYTPQSGGNVSSPVKCTSTNEGILIVIMILVGTMFLVVGYAFFVALFSLFGRMIGLFINIIFAPLAFVSLIVPRMETLSSFGWNDWLSSLMTNAFAAPIFFFFILLISILSKTSIIPNPIPGTMSPGILLVLVMIQFLLLVTMLIKATNYVKKSSGAIGEALGGLAGGLLKIGGTAIAGVAVGTAAGGLAVAAQNSIGVAGSKLANSEKFTKWANSDNAAARFIGRGIINTGDAAAKKSYNLGVPLAAAGFNTKSVVSSWSNDATKGGLQGRAAWKADRDTKFSEKLKENHTEAAELKKNIKKRKDDIEAEEDMTEAAKTAIRDFEEDFLKPLKEKLQRAKDIKDEPETKRLQAEIDKAKDGRAFKDASGATQAAFKKQTKVKGTPQDLKYDDLIKEIKNKEKKVSELKRGERDANGRQIKVTKLDAIKGVPLANGRKTTDKDVANGVIRTSSLSLEQMEKLIETNAKANAKAFLYNKAVSTGKHVTPERDKLGNITSFHVDPNQPGHGSGANNGVRALVQGVRNAGVAYSATAIVGTAAGAALGFPIAGLAATVAGLATAVGQVAAEVSASRNNHPVGQSYAAAEAAHHTGGSHGDHGGHGGHGAHGHSTSVGAQIGSLLKSTLGSLTGGKSGGGGGGGGGGGHGH